MQLDNNTRKITEWVNCRKEILGLNNRMLAARANISEQSLSMYMTGYRSWSLANLVRIVMALGGKVTIELNK